MAQGFFTINLPDRCRAKLDELANASMRSRPNVIEVLIENATVANLLLKEAVERAEEQPTHA